MILKKLIQKMKKNISTTLYEYEWDPVKLNERKRMEEMAEISYDRDYKLYWVEGTAFETHREAILYAQQLREARENMYIYGYCTPDDEKEKYRDNSQEGFTKDEAAFKEITEQMLHTYIKKNRDYGGAFERGMERDGIISALTRMYDKLDRLHSLKDKDPEVVEETVEDTLMDLANYAIMTRICLTKLGQKEGTVVYADNQPIMSVKKSGTNADFSEKGDN